MADAINLAELRAAGPAWITETHLVALVEAVEAAQETMAALDRALAANERGSETFKHLEFAVGATLQLRDALARFAAPVDPSRDAQSREAVMAERVNVQQLREQVSRRIDALVNAGGDPMEGVSLAPEQVVALLDVAEAAQRVVVIWNGEADTDVALGELDGALDRLDFGSQQNQPDSA
jgi:hypothetical protein